MQQQITPPEQPEIPVIGIGYSAGGLEAARLILSKFPADTGVAFVVIQHLQADSESHLAEILGKSTKMPVLVIENGMRVQADTIFVIPPSYDVVLNGDFLNLHHRDDAHTHHLGVDFFFSSLSHNRKSKAIGIVLSGTGSDGTLGLKAIKAEGGITIAQDPKTAKFDGMPRSAIASGVVDLILSPEAIATELVRLAKHPYTKAFLQTHLDSTHLPEPPTQSKSLPLFSRILEILLEQTKIDFSLYKSSTIQRRIERQMMLRKVDTIEKYAEYLNKNTDEVKALYEDIFIHVTDFFRDPETFTTLRETAFPELIQGKSKDLPIRIWIPGCATGEEAYSIAISLIEFLGEKNLDIPINLFASDISEPALQVARKGVYSDQQLRNLSPERLQNFFEKVKGGYKITKRIRDLCIFSRHDVTSNPPIPRLDLISCRNVLIYFSAELQKRLFPVFYYALNDSGFLWLGRAENPETNSKLFVAIDKSHKIFAKVRGTFVQQQQRYSTPNYRSTTPQLVPHVPATRTGEIARNADQLILYRYSPPSVLVDYHGEILQYRGRTTPYLEPSPGYASHSLLKMANPDIVNPLRICLQAAKKQNAHFRKEDVEFEFEGQNRRANIDVSPLNPTVALKERQFLVVFEDASAIKAAKRKVKLPPKKASGKKDVYSRLETITEHNDQLRQELDSAREYQQSLIEEYESSQEEVTSANEELRSTNEELQSTNEELHSTNEELHSTNEELGSAKEELQATNEELLSTNDELQKRNEELENAFKEIDSVEKRFRLMVDSVKDYAILMLDLNGNVTSWNEGAKRIKGYEASEIIGKHFSHFYTPEDLARRHPDDELKIAFQNGRYEEEGWRVKKDSSRFWASVTITRINDPQGKPIGYAKVTRDLTERRRVEEARLEQERKLATLEQLKENEAILDQIFSESPAFMALISVPEYRFIKTNTEYGRLLRRSNIVGKTIHEVFPELEAQGFFDLLNQVAKSGKPFSGRDIPIHLSPVDGVGSTLYLDFIYQPLRRANGEIYAIAAQGYDVTEKYLAREVIERAKDAVENERENFRNLFKQTPEMVCILKGPKHVFEFVNEAHVRVLGFDATGMGVREAQPESKEVHGILDDVYRTGITSELHEIPVTLTNRLRYFNLTYSARLDDEGKINGVMILGTEITQEVQAREDLKKAVQARDEFLSIASHELKTPLTSLQIQAQLRKRIAIKRNPEDFTFEKLNKMFDSDKLQIDRLTRLIDDMLDVTRITAHKLALRTEQVDLSTILNEVVDRLSSQLSAAQTKIEVQIVDPCNGLFDRFRIEQVLLNLLTNAMRYGDGKTIHVTLKREGSLAKIIFKDQGIGIAKVDQQRIFQQFERATSTSVASGLGLGLYIAKEIVEAHEGSIHVESELGKGATFIVELPIKNTLS